MNWKNSTRAGSVKATVLCLLALNTVGFISRADSPPAKTWAQLWEETERQAAVLIAMESEFSKTHPFKGQIARVAMNKLGAEGFSCSLEYKVLPTLEEGSVDRFTTKNVPMVYCSKGHVKESRDDLCRVFWAAFEVNWKDASRHPDILKKELDVSTIKNEMYFCRVSIDKN